MATKVVHCKKEPYDVLIDRTTAFGNPFVIGKDGDRVEVLSKFAVWLYKHPKLIEKAKQELNDKVLGCWCKPEDCHGDIYVALLDGAKLNPKYEPLKR